MSNLQMPDENEHEDWKPYAVVHDKQSSNPASELEEKQSDDEGEDESQYPKPAKVAIITLSLALATFVIALDQTIVATATPTIADEFHTTADVGWYATSYLFASCFTSLVWGKAFRYFRHKPVYLSALAIFELGSLLSATAQSSAVFIVGRALAGIGGGGISAGYSMALFDTYTGSVYHIASVVAPLIGGALTHNVSWRWCFYINLPLCVPAILAFTFLVHLSHGHDEYKLPLGTKLKRFDMPGAIVGTSGAICILLALQWGGIVFAWNSGRIIGLFAAGAILVPCFLVMQWRSGSNALVPFHMLGKRSLYCAAIYLFASGATMFIAEFYFPLWFQSVRGANPLTSGLMLLPLIIANVAAALCAGTIITRWGRPMPFMMLGAILLSIGFGLVTTWGPHTPNAEWIVYQAFVGAGAGFGVQAATLPAQILLPNEEVAMALATLNFVFLLGAVLLIPVAQTTFVNQLSAGLRASGLEVGAPISTLGVTQLLHSFSGPQRTRAIEVYNQAIVPLFDIGLGTALLAFLTSLGVSYKLSTTKKRSS